MSLMLDKQKCFGDINDINFMTQVSVIFEITTY